MKKLKLKPTKRNAVPARELDDAGALGLRVINAAKHCENPTHGVVVVVDGVKKEEERKWKGRV